MAKDPKDKGGAYPVGRGKPPSHSRFKPGQSGNPGGRKKGSRNLKTMLQELMLEEIELIENGKKRTMPLVGALLKRQMQQGLQGDLRAIKDLLDRFERHMGPEAEVEEELPEDDRAILQRVLALKVATAPRHSPPANPAPDYEALALTGADSDE